MTLDRVVDASVAAAVAFTEPRAREAALLLEGLRLFAPRLLAYELASIARTKIRQNPGRQSMILKRLTETLDAGIHWVDVDYLRVVELALETGLSTYDASYLYVARSIGAGLVTFDQRLAAAARSL